MVAVLLSELAVFVAAVPPRPVKTTPLEALVAPAFSVVDAIEELVVVLILVGL